MSLSSKYQATKKSQLWEAKLHRAVKDFITYYRLEEEDSAHFVDTPDRIVKSFRHFVPADGSPEKHLSVRFPAPGFAMVHVSPIRIFSTCAHHLMPVVGIAHFAYTPGSEIVGLSKIPRFVDALARQRPTTQERLCKLIVSAFEYHVQPEGCGVWIKAWHSCMSARGIEECSAMVQTTESSFAKDSEAYTEFCSAIDRKQIVIG